MCGKPMAWDFRMLYDSDRVFRILLDDFQSRYRIWAAPVGKQVFSDTIGTDLARRAGTVMGGTLRCKERLFSNAEFSRVWAYNPRYGLQGGTGQRQHHRTGDSRRCMLPS